MTRNCSDSRGFREDRERARASGGDDWRRSRDERRQRRRERKERVLHTRVSQQLSDDIRSLAEDLRVPVSNLVRNVLEEAFSVVEEVSDDVGGILEDVLAEAETATDRFRRYQARRRSRDGRERGRRRAEPAEPDSRDARDASAEEEPSPPTPPLEMPDAFREVVAWQPVILNSAQHCASTEREIAPGEEAFMGLTAQGFSGLYVSREGLDDLHGRR